MIMTKFISKLKIFRLIKGMTQGDLAKTISVKQPQIAQLESGKRGKLFSRFNKDKMEILRKLGYKGDVTDTIDLDSIANRYDAGISTNDMARTVIKNKNNYKNQKEFFKDVLNVFGIDIMLGVNTNGDSEVKLFYKGDQIFIHKERNGMYLSTLET